MPLLKRKQNEKGIKTKKKTHKITEIKNNLLLGV